MMTSVRTFSLLVLVSAANGCAPWSRVDFTDLVTSGRDGWQRPEQVVEALALAPGDHVAEIGAGDGYWLPWLSEAVGPTGHVYAVEVDDDLVAALEKRVAEEGFGNVTVVLGGDDDPALPDGAIDLAFTCLTYHHIEGRPDYFRRLRGDLSERGRVAHLDDRPDVPPPFRWFQNEGHWSDPEAVRREMTEAGYRRLAEHDLLPVQSFQTFAPSERAEAPAR
jgi:ubiquinone/menaquinone biosynthesis C-methylase UbiE